MAFVVRGCRWSCLIAALFSWACADDSDSHEPDDTETETDTGTEIDTETETETETETDTGESETPPALPSLCSVSLFNTEMSGDGDGRSPGLARGDSALAAWLYDPSATGEDEQWRIQTGVYDPAAAEIAVGEPFSPASASVSLSLTASQASFGAAWLDSRWDADCNAAAPDSCIVEVAFAVLDSTGASSAADPMRVSTTGAARNGTAVTATPDGWLVAWIGEAEGNLRAMVAAIDADGAVGTPTVVSGEETFFEDSPSVSLASGTGGAMALWSADLESIVAQPIGFDGAPSGDPVIIDEGVNCATPRVAATATGFIATWSRKSYDDFEVYSVLLDGNGLPAGEANRLTWTTSDATGAVPAWNATELAVVWLSDRANGSSTCVEDNCKDQLFGAALDAATGALASEPVLLSNNANPSSFPTLAWDGAAWSPLWEVRRNMRQQVYRGRFACE